MALKLLQPNLVPAGQFDLHDDYADLVTGGECAMLEAATVDGTDAYASDTVVVGPQTQVVLGKAGPSAARGSSNEGASMAVFLADEGTAGEGAYGTLFGSVIGGTAGQGTGKGTLSTSGVVTVGPRTSFGSGKCTLFGAHGLYGLSTDIVTLSALVTNDLMNATGGHSSPTSATNDGLWAEVAETGVGEEKNYAAIFIGSVNDSSLVSTTFTHASGSAGDAEYYAVYFCGAQRLTKES